MKIAILTVDSRPTRLANNDIGMPCLGTALFPLIEGFDSLGSACEFHVISCAQHRLPSPEKLAGNVWFHSLHVPKWGWLRSGYLGCILAIRKKLREIGPDVVHAQGTERDCAISAVFTPYPKVLTIHGNLRLIKKTVGFRPFSAMWFQTLIEGFVVPRFDGVVCITNYTRRAVEHEVPKTWVVPNAVEPSFFNIERKRTNPPEILVIANVDERKNQNAFIRALDPLAAEMGFVVRFYGRCGTDAYGEEFHSLLESRPWCQYGGMIERPALREQFARASLLALPTHEDNCPMVVLEAMAAGVPVVASQVGGIPDLIDGRTTGLFIQPDDPAGIKRAVQSILQDPDGLGTRLAQAAKQDALARFHPNVVANRHLEIYREVVNRS